MGDMSEYYGDGEYPHYEDEGDVLPPVWVTRDKRVIAMKDMSDAHLAATIRFLEARGLRTYCEVKNDPVAAAEAKMTGFGSGLQAKYNQLLAENDRRAQVPAADHPAT